MKLIEPFLQSSSIGNIDKISPMNIRLIKLMTYILFILISLYFLYNLSLIAKDTSNYYSDLTIIKRIEENINAKNLRKYESDPVYSIRNSDPLALRAVPDDLANDYSKLSFYNPINFNPWCVSVNLQSAKTAWERNPILNIFIPLILSIVKMFVYWLIIRISFWIKFGQA